MKIAAWVTAIATIALVITSVALACYAAGNIRAMREGQRKADAIWELQRRPWIDLSVRLEGLNVSSDSVKIPLPITVTNVGLGLAVDCDIVVHIDTVAFDGGTWYDSTAALAQRQGFQLGPSQSRTLPGDWKIPRVALDKLLADSFDLHLSCRYSGAETGQKYYTELVYRYHHRWGDAPGLSIFQAGCIRVYHGRVEDGRLILPTHATH